MRTLYPTRRSSIVSSSGYTLLEMILVTVVLGIVGLTSSYVVMESMKVYARTAPAVEASYHARLSTERLKRDIRDLADPDSITSFTASNFAFTTSEGVPVAYGYSAGQLTRNGEALAQGLSSFEFRYRAKDGAPAALPADLHLVDIRLVASRRTYTEPVSMTVFPRALRR